MGTSSRHVVDFEKVRGGKDEVTVTSRSEFDMTLVYGTQLQSC